MRAKEFLNQLERNSIVAAIRDAEAKSSGEIRVFVSRKTPEDAVADAQSRFVELGMSQTRHRNAVLIYVAPRVRKFAIIGDTAVHARCGDGFWKSVSEEIASHFRQGRFTDGILQGITRAGDLLAQHFPRQHGDSNDLSDEVAHD